MFFKEPFYLFYFIKNTVRRIYMNREIDTYLYADNQSEEEPFVLYNEKTIKLFNFLYYITNIEQENCK